MTVRRSKIRPPRPPAALLLRPALLARLQQAADRGQVVLLQAPAGYGKSTLLAAATEGRRTAWVSIDAGDGLAQIVEALHAALEPFDLPWRQSSRRLVEQARSGEADVLAERLAEALAAEGGDGVIVLDDLQHCSDPQVHRWIDGWVDAPHGRWSLWIGSRGQPPLAVQRWRLRGELVLVGADELAFDRDEIRRLALQHGLHDPARTAALVRRTGGWPAALRLALDSPADSPDSASDDALCDYLASEVIDRMPADLRDFLLACAVLPELTPSRTAAVSGDTQAARHLDALRHRDLFVNEVDDDGTLKLHDLFRRSLLQRLQRQDPARLARLLRRAAEGERDPVRRVASMLDAGDESAAEAELEACSRALITDGAGAQVDLLLTRFAPARRRGSLPLAIVQAQLAWSRWDTAGMLHALQQVPAAAVQDAPPEGRDVYHAYLAVAFDNAYRVDDRQRVVQTLQQRPLAPLPQLLTLLCQPTGSLADAARTRRAIVAAADRLGTADAWYQAAPPMTQPMLPGTWHDTWQMAATMRRLAADEPNGLRLWSTYLQAWLELWRGDVEAALQSALESAEVARWDGAPADGLAHIHALVALLHAVRGDGAAALRALRRSREAASAPSEPRQHWVHGSQHAAWRTRVAIVLGDLPALRAALADWPPPAAGSELMPRYALTHRMAQACSQALEDRTGEAVTAWSALLPDLDALEGQGEPSELRLRLCAALCSLGRTDEARSLLATTLGETPSELDLGPALLAGPQVLQTLVSAGAGLSSTAARQAWLERAAQQCHSARQSPPEADAPGLSAREREVLECIARGDSNKAIARRLGLSAHTVKRHVANLLDKLDLTSRGQAAAWWREHLPPPGGA